MNKLFDAAIMEEIIAFGECMIRHAMSNAFVEQDLNNLLVIDSDRIQLCIIQPQLPLKSLGEKSVLI